jgi:hypothetical protein
VKLFVSRCQGVADSIHVPISYEVQMASSISKLDVRMSMMDGR